MQLSARFNTETKICGDTWQPGAGTVTAMHSTIKWLDSCSSFAVVKEVFPPIKWLWQRIRWIWAEDLGNIGSNWKKSGRCEDFSRAGLTPPYCAWPACLFSPGSLDEEPGGQTQMWVTQRMEAARGHHLRAAAYREAVDVQRLLWLKIQKGKEKGVTRPS